MRHIGQIVFLFLCFSYVSCEFHRKYSSNRTSNSSSRSIYELVKLRQNVARLAKSHRNNQTYRVSFFSDEAHTIQSKTYQPEDLRQQFFMEPLKASIVVCVIVIATMGLIVGICILFRYLCYNENYRQCLVESATERIPKIESSRYTYEFRDSRNFERKHRERRTRV